MKRTLFLQWALFTCLTAIGMFIAAMLGWWRYVIEDDPTHITLVTFAVFAASVAWCGRLAWRVTDGDDPDVIKISLNSTSFASSACVTIGLLGTVVGYLILVKSETGGDNAAEQLVGLIKLGMGTVLINTFIGGFLGFLIEVQSHFINQANEFAKLDASHLMKNGEHHE